MKNLNRSYYNPPFSHIYVEREVAEDPETKRILAQFPQAEVIAIDHYKDVFCRSRQDYVRQHVAQNLILAAKHGELLYPGAPVCQSFGNEHFYYTSCVMNCVFDCEYCYLKGMYPSANLVVFVNLEDIFAEVEKRLAAHPVYLCVSYDTDLLALEHLTGYAARWIEFVLRMNTDGQRLRIELRTKGTGGGLWQTVRPEAGVICAFTISPQQVIDAYEHGTASLAGRLAGAEAAMEQGFSVRLCFDPMIYCSDWKKHYDAMFAQVCGTLDLEKLSDVSVGTFRISQDYLKKMRKNEPDSAVVQFPYQNDSGVYHYPTALMEEMEQYMTEKLAAYLPAERIFRWKE